MAQDDLFKPTIKPPVPPLGKTGPRLWVRRVMLFADPNNVIRDIGLKPGLNIIWTPDISRNESHAVAHGSGKSTFCRLLRGCLGEPDFVLPEQRTRINRRFPNGFVAAEVMIDGTCWVTIRFWGLGGRDYAVKCDSIEFALQRGHQDGDEATLDGVVSSSLLSELRGRAPSDIGDKQIWDVLRAWTSRDQECRLSDVLDWRSPKTGTRSKAQQLGVAGKLAMVRLALRAIDDEELEAAEMERKLVKAAEKEREQAAIAKFVHLNDLNDLRTALGAGQEVELEDSLTGKGLISLAEKAVQDAMRVALPPSPDLNGIIDEKDEAVSRRTDLAEERSKHSTIYATKILEAGHLKDEAEIAVFSVENHHVMCPICRVPVSEIKAKGCGISVNPCNMEEIEKQNAKKMAEAKELEKQANISFQEIKALNAQIAQLDDVIRNLTKQIRLVSRIATNNIEKAQEIQEGVLEKRILLDKARKLYRKRSDIANSGVAQNRLDEEREKMRSGRQRSLPKIGQISDVYRGILTTCFPGGMDGSIELDGNGLKVDAYFSGRSDVSTAALESLKIVAFDLSAMHRASEGKADLPAFLLHDSPREADLDSALYAAIFDLAAEWEADAAQCSFQYIVTTTTAPPDYLQGDEFVKLKMSSTPASDRLFRTDL